MAAQKNRKLRGMWTVKTLLVHFQIGTWISWDLDERPFVHVTLEKEPATFHNGSSQSKQGRMK